MLHTIILHKIYVIGDSKNTNLLSKCKSIFTNDVNMMYAVSINVSFEMPTIQTEVQSLVHAAIIFQAFSPMIHLTQENLNFLLLLANHQ